MAKQLELSQMIASLRSELSSAQSEGEGKGIRFTVEDVELELDIIAEEQAEGSIAAKFYVLTSQFKGSKKGVVTQKIKLKLKPEEIDGSTKKPLKVRGKRKAKNK